MPLTRRKSSPRQQAAETATATRPIKPVDSPPPARERRYTPFAGDPFALPLTADEALALLPRTTPARRALALPNDDEEATTLHEQGPHIVGPHIVAPAVIVAQQTGSDALLSQPPRRTFAVGLAVGLVVGAIPALIALLM